MDTNAVNISAITPHSQRKEGYRKISTKVVAHQFVGGCIALPITSPLIERVSCCFVLYPSFSAALSSSWTNLHLFFAWRLSSCFHSIILHRPYTIDKLLRRQTNFQAHIGNSFPSRNQSTLSTYWAKCRLHASRTVPRGFCIR